jgi:hypothetical protein
MLIFVAEHALEIADLPQAFACGAVVSVSACLFCSFNERNEASRRATPAHHEVQVVRHETVDRNFNPFALRGAQNFTTHGRDDVRIHEQRPSLKCRQDKGIRMPAAIGEASQPSKAPRQHATHMATDVPTCTSNRRRRPDLQVGRA